MDNNISNYFHEHIQKKHISKYYFSGAEQEFAFFSSKQKKWIMSYQGDTIIKNLKQIFTDIQVNQSTQPHIHN